MSGRCKIEVIVSNAVAGERLCKTRRHGVMYVVGKSRGKSSVPSLKKFQEASMGLPGVGFGRQPVVGPPWLGTRELDKPDIRRL